MILVGFGVFGFGLGLCCVFCLGFKHCVVLEWVVLIFVAEFAAWVLFVCWLGWLLTVVGLRDLFLLYCCWVFWVWLFGLGLFGWLCLLCLLVGGCCFGWVVSGFVVIVA